MDVYYDGFYKSVRTNLSRIGLWCDDDPNFRKIRKSLFTFTLLTSFCLQISEFLLLPFTRRLLYKFFIRISPTAFSSAIYCWMIYNEKKLKKLYDQIRIEFLTRSTKERKLMESYANNARNYMLVLSYFYTAIIIVTAGPDILSMLRSTTTLNETLVRKSPLSMGYHEKVQSYYFVVLIPLYVIVLTEVIVTVGTWNAYIHLIHHICAMFNIAVNMVEHTLSEKRVKFSFNKNETCNALVRIIDYHNDCIRFVNNINVLCESILLFELSLTIVIVSMDVLYLADIKYSIRDYNELLLYTLYISCHMYLLFGCCHFGQNILDHGANFHKKICTVPWYVTPPRIQRMCLLIMAKSMKPLHLSIGKIFVMSYELLIMVLNASISYAMVLRSLSINT